MPKNNILTRSKKVKADELAIQGKLREACALYLLICRIDPSDIDAWSKLSDTHRRLGDVQQAEKCARRAVMQQPGSELAQLALAFALHAQGRFDEATVSYRQAIAIQPTNADVYYRLGNALLRGSGSPSEAEACYRKAIQIQPNFVDALSNLASVLGGLGDIEGAEKIIQKVISLRPNSAHLLCEMGDVKQIGGRIEEAQELFQRALQIEPSSIIAIGRLARLWEKTSRLPEAKEMVARGLQMRPDDPTVNLAAGKLALREGRTQEGIDSLNRLLPLQLPTADAGGVRILLGQLYDRQGDAEHAFPLFVEGNQLVAIASLGTEANKDKYLNKAIENLSRFSRESMPNQVPHSDQAEGRAPIFMIGFPRSGTTLLEQILGSHPNLQTLEERDTVATMLKSFLAMAGDNEHALAELDQTQVWQLRKVYFDRVAHHISLRADALLVDKMPLNTAYVPLLWRVFPHAKFILSVRHPCDVCLSCFMQNFAINESMVGFTTLENTSRIYSLVMGAWRKYSQELPIDYWQIRYEDLIEDVEGQAQQLLDFIGVPWNDAVLTHTEYAKERTNIRTPSYSQVTQPIYQRSKYRWERYEQQLSNVMPELQPFIECFGYA